MSCAATTGWQKVVDPNPGGCEWCPEHDRASYTTDAHYKTAKATWSLGTGQKNIHVCDSCATLPRFKRFKKRVKLRVPNA